MTYKLRFRWNAKLSRWQSRHRRGFGHWYIGTCQYCGKSAIVGVTMKRCDDCRRTHWAHDKSFKSPAHSAVTRARKLGELPRLDGSIPCVDCGRPAQCFDHRDYSKPLAVDPVCRSCNSRRGMAIQTAAVRVPMKAA